MILIDPAPIALQSDALRSGGTRTDNSAIGRMSDSMTFPDLLAGVADSDGAVSEGVGITVVADNTYRCDTDWKVATMCSIQ